MTHPARRRCAGDARSGHTPPPGVTDAAPPRTAPVGSSVVAREPPVIASAAALRAQRQLPAGVGRQDAAAEIEDAHQALARVGTGSGDVVDRLLAEIRARHQRGHAHAVELARAFDAVYRLVVHGAPRSWG